MGNTEKTEKVARPREKVASRAKQKKLHVYKSWCKRCGICIAFCPKGALEKDFEGVPRWKSAQTCVGCRMCELRCPDFAIEVVDEERADVQGK
jgi:2-oxoglutarate ferredoxin oxidoreductase subunit delta